MLPPGPFLDKSRHVKFYPARSLLFLCVSLFNPLTESCCARESFLKSSLCLARPVLTEKSLVGRVACSVFLVVAGLTDRAVLTLLLFSN